MNDLIGKQVLASCQNWFVGPDGKDYKAIYGTFKAVTEASKAVGFIPNRSHANWFYSIGGMVIMGCQIMYLMECKEPPSKERSMGWHVHEGKVLESDRPCLIYFAD